MASLFGVVLTNAAIGQRVQTTMTVLKLVDRQEALLDRIGRDLLELREEQQSGRNAVDVLSDLTSSSSLFGGTLAALQKGGTTADERSRRIYIDPASSPVARDTINRTLTLWQPIDRKIGALSTSTQPAAINEAITSVGSPELRGLVGTLRDQYAIASVDDLNALEERRNLLLISSVLCFVILVASLFQRVTEGQRQVRLYAHDLEGRNDQLLATARQLADAKRGTDLIMETVRQGLMLIDEQYLIQPQYARELETIFKREDLAGLSLLAILERILTERMFQTSRDYLGLLFDPTKKERTVMKVNPLDEIEVSFASPTAVSLRSISPSRSGGSSRGPDLSHGSSSRSAISASG